MSTRAAAVLTAAVTTVLGGCVTSRIDTSFNDAVELSDTSSVVLLARRQNVEHETESGFMNCIKKAITSGSTRVARAAIAP